MTVRLTITGDTAAEVDAQLLAYIEQRRFTESEFKPAPATGANGQEGISPTNDDYRRAIKAIPRGKVASYTVVSEVVRGDPSAPQKVAGLAANDDSLETAYRVIKKDGSIAAGFRWTDGRMGGADEGRRALEKEGVRFDIHGRVLEKFMLSAEELRVYYEGRGREGGA
jgi:alkylated DNA nucleotide flippase Atl1